MRYSYNRGEHNRAFNRHIEKLSAAASLTHTKYGNSNQPAAGTAFQSSIDVARMANHNMTISAKARPGDLSRKKRADHATLSNNCSRKSCTGAAVKPAFRQTNQAAIAIAMNKIVQTGPNSQLGAVQRGLLRPGVPRPKRRRSQQRPQSCGSKADCDANNESHRGSGQAVSLRVLSLIS